jgi:hypothetical protein
MGKQPDARTLKWHDFVYSNAWDSTGIPNFNVDSRPQ